MDYFDEKTDQFYDFLNQTFDLKKCKTWNDVSQNVTHLKVKRTYRVFAELFPRSIDYTSELKSIQSSFSSIHFGTLKANRIINEIVRFSLYSDKIIVFHPLQNPSVTDQKIDPRRNPKQWLPDFLDALYFYIVIQKWVKSGIVKLIVNPCEYDLELRDKIYNQAKTRLLSEKSKEIFENGIESAENDLAEILAIYSKNKNKDQIVDYLLNLENPVFTQIEAVEFADKIIEAIPRMNPLYEKIDRTLFHKTGMLSTTKGGGSLEAMLYIAKASGGNIYTPSETNWAEMKSIGMNDFWAKTNHLYSKIPLNFLNNVDTGFALKLREEDRLAGIRQQLKKIYSELSSIDINNLSESKIKFVQEGFIEEVKKAEGEWKSIKQQADISRKYWLSANVGLPIILNEFSILPIALGSIAWLYNNEKKAKIKMDQYKLKNPISAYIDLKNQRQDFLTEFRNCIF